MNCIQSFLLFSVVVTCFSGCGAGKATLFVDNDSKSSYRVEIAGHRSLYVGPGSKAKRHLPYGEHKIIVKKNKKVIFEGVKKFEPHDDGPGWRHFLLDPEADTNYYLREFYYYKDTETANKSKSSRSVKRLPKKHWIDVPKSATALEPMAITITSGKGEKTSRLCVVRKKTH